MDAKQISEEIVRIRRRLAEIEAENSSDADTDDEKKQLEDRMHQLQDELTDPGSHDRPEPTQADKIQWLPPV